ncbi:MAG: CPBP family intramembrane metalloprotease [Pirellulaceae bacterium]|nr:CPBP family intramembrane metalloprotease [Pirellulaceae bacterium]
MNSDRSLADGSSPRLPGTVDVPLAMPPKFSWLQQNELISKELRETLRDRRTLVTLLVMPLLLYPLLGLGFRFLAWQQWSVTRPEYIVALQSDPQAQWLANELSVGQRLIQESSADTRDNLSTETVGDAIPEHATEPSRASEPRAEVKIRVPRGAEEVHLPQLVREGVVDLGVRIEGSMVELSQELAGDRSVTVEMLENSQSLTSRRAAEYVSRCLEISSRERVRRWAVQRQADFQLPIRQLRTNVAVGQQTSAILGLLPLVLLLMTVTGGVYPAIDLTAGERERHTLEMLVTLPIPTWRLLLAKYVAVVTVTLLTGCANLMAMSLTLYALGLDRELLGPGGMTWLLTAKLFLALSALAFFYAAVLLSLTSSARSFKEAQAYLIPLLLLSIVPGMVILLPGWNLNYVTAGLPLVNILLLVRETLEGGALPGPAALALVLTVLYAVLALSLAARWFAADAVAVGSRGSWKDLLRSPPEVRRFPSTSLALVGLAMLLPAYFLASGMLSRDVSASAMNRLMMSAGLTVALFLGLPVLLLRWQRVALCGGLGLTKASSMQLLGGLMLGIAAWPWVFELTVASQWLARGLGWPALDQSSLEMVNRLLASWQQLPLAALMIALGMIPGVCEEIFFRGFLFAGLRRSLNPLPTVLITAVIFGLFHLVLAGAVAPERLIPSTLLGLVLGWVRWRSGSLLPGMVMHAVNNSCVLALARFQDKLQGWGLESNAVDAHLPTLWLGIAAVLFILGILMVRSMEPAWAGKEDN